MSGSPRISVFLCSRPVGCCELRQTHCSHVSALNATFLHSSSKSCVHRTCFKIWTRPAEIFGLITRLVPLPEQGQQCNRERNIAVYFRHLLVPLLSSEISFDFSSHRNDWRTNPSHITTDSALSRWTKRYAPREFLSLAAVPTDNRSIHPLMYTLALEGHLEFTILWDIHATNIKL
jgi:hypothetical protein